MTAQSKRLLVVDRRLALEYGIADFVSLMPYYGGDVPWKIRQDEYLGVCAAIVKAKTRIARHLAATVYAPALSTTVDCAEVLFYPAGNGATFLVIDRLLRLNRLLSSAAAPGVALAPHRYRFETLDDISSLQFHLVEQHAGFNQWVISELAPHLPVGDVAKAPTKDRADIATPTVKFWRLFARHIVARHPRLKDFINKIRKFLFFRNTPLKEVLAGSLRNWPDAASKLAHFLRIPGAIGAVVTIEMGPVGNALKAQSGFFWPKGPLIQAPFRAVLKTEDRRVTRASLLAQSSAIATILREAFTDLGEQVVLPPESFAAAAKLIVTLLTKSFVERLGPNVDAMSTYLSRYKPKAFLNVSAVGADSYGLFTFVCRKMAVPVIAHQHSAWGGYLAGGPLVTELLMLGCDDYVTFGWLAAESGLSQWRREAIPMPSPFISEMRRESSDLKRPAKKHRRLLLAMGFLYRFPMVYNSSLRLDTLAIWVGEITKVIAAITAAGIQVDIKMYNFNNAVEWRQALDHWLRVGNGLAREFPEHNASIREMLRFKSLYSTYDAVLWDVPTGGFTECVARQVDSFALWSPHLLHAIPEAQPMISRMCEVGVFFADGAALEQTLSRFYDEPDWFGRVEVQEALGAFMNNFCKIDTDWCKSWHAYLDRLQIGPSAFHENMPHPNLAQT